jgi:hypothetical protein
MTVLSTDGASQTVRSVASTVAQGQEIAKSVLGFVLAELARRMADKGSAAGTPAILDTDSGAGHRPPLD